MNKILEKMITLATLAMLFAGVAPVFAQTNPSSAAQESYNRRNKAVVSITKHARRVGTINCRSEAEACRAILAPIIGEMQFLSEQHGLNFWIVAGVAMETTNFNPVARNNHGFVGILGSNETDYRSCSLDDRLCQRQVLEASVLKLKAAIEECGTIRNGLQRYFGRGCTSEPRFARHVLRWANQLEVEANRVPDVNVCDTYPIFCSRLFVNMRENQ